jgi:uncharacterized membrane protein
MTRDAFLSALRAHLRRVPAKTVNEIVADYASHFDEGMAHGRNEADIAAALGDPARLARELRAEAGLKRWDEERSASAAGAAILAILSLGAIDVLILFPILLVVAAVLFALACVSIAMLCVGVVLLVIAPFGILVGFVGTLAQALLAGIGCFAMGASIGALTILIGKGLTHLLIRYGRFHVGLLKPVTAQPA